MDSVIERLSERKRTLLAVLRAERDAGPGFGGRHRAAQWLRHGSGSCVLLVHPIGGEVYCYTGLARRLRTDNGVLALAADELLDEQEQPDMTELAATYLERLADAGGRPGLVAGWSFGGVLGYEIARQLADAGRPCPLVLIDAFPTPEEHIGDVRPAADLLRDFIDDLLRSGGHDPATLAVQDDAWLRPPTEVFGLVGSWLRERGLGGVLDAEELAARFRVYAAATRALDGYRPGGYEHPVHLIRTASGPDPAPLWRDVVRGPLTVSTFDTDHYGLMRAPSVDRIAELVDELCGQDRGGVLA